MENITLIIGSVRNGRIGDQVANWVTNQLDVTKSNLKLIDLKELNLPYFNEPISPLWMKRMGVEYINQTAKTFASDIQMSDKIIFVTPEYNHSVPASLAGAIEWVGAEWEGKKVYIVSYSVSADGGSRAIKALHPIMDELKMVFCGSVSIGELMGAYTPEHSIDNTKFTSICDKHSEEFKSLGIN